MNLKNFNMEEDQNQSEQAIQPAHVSYRDYKKKLARNPRQGVILFISAFFALLLIFLGAAKLMSPDVDIAIGDDAEVSSEQEGIERTAVDDRLKQIQDEDGTNEVAGAQDTTFSPELDEKVKIPKAEKPEEPLSQQEEQPIVLEHAKPEPKPVLTPQVKSETPQPTQTVVPVSITAKVFVGNYSTAEQAEVAKGIIMDAGLGVNAFVKNVGGAYTLQVGSYSSKEKAQSLANDLLRNNFPARVVVEQH